jgi:hypothetical protein
MLSVADKIFLNVLTGDTVLRRPRQSTDSKLADAGNAYPARGDRSHPRAPEEDMPGRAVRGCPKQTVKST